LVAVSALPWLVTAVVYARSCFVGDLVRWAKVMPGPPRVDRHYTVSLNAGVAEFYTYDERFGARRRNRPPPTMPSESVRWELTRVVDPYEGRAVRSVWNRLGFHNDHWQYPRGGEHLVVVPLWPLLVIFAAVPVAWDLRRRRRRAALRKADAGAADQSPNSPTPPPPPTPSHEPRR
jgi:hypothetical protein